MKYIALLILCTQAFSAPQYLDDAHKDSLAYFTARKNNTRLLEDLQTQLQSATEQLLNEKKIYDMADKLFQQTMLSEVDYRFSLLKYQLSQFEVSRLKWNIEETKASVQIFEYSIQYANQKKIALEDYYKVFNTQWKAQCEVGKVDLLVGKARLEFSEFEFKMYENLSSKHVDSLKTYYEKLNANVAAKNEVKNLERKDIECWKKIPTIDDLRKSVY